MIAPVKRLNLVFILFCSFLFHCSAPLWQKVDLAQRQGNLETAALELENHLQQFPEDAGAYYELGEIRGQQERWEDMLAALTACDKLGRRWHTETANTREFYWAQNINRGIAAQNEADLVEAISCFQAAVLILPEKTPGHRLLGEALATAGQPAEAITAFEKALQLDAKDRRTRRFLMRLYFSSGNYRGALAAAQILEDHTNDDTEAIRFIACSYDRLDERTEAVAAYQRLTALSAYPADFEAFAAFQFRCGEYETAINLSREAIARGGNDIQNLRAIAQMQLMKKDFSGVLQTADEILARQADDVAALQLKQVSHAALGEQQQLEIISHRIKEIKASAQ
jgi:tetratricopeptide (TPR) repeat protein